MIVVDASVWVSASVFDDAFHHVSLAWIEARDLEGEALADPFIVLAEVSGAVARRSGNVREADTAVRVITSLPGIILLSVDEALAREAARLAADLGLRGADAVYVATAVRLGCPLVTWDDEMLRRAGRVVAAYRPVA